MSREQNKVWTIRDIILWGENYFATKKVEAPRLSIELLLCNLLEMSRLDLYLNYELPLCAIELQTLKSQIRRLLKGEPLQYILGWTQFLQYKILLNKKVFIPRPETEYMVNFIINKLKSQQTQEMKILDIGCGSGAISVALADFFKKASVLAIDIDTNALLQTEENAKLHNLDNIKTMNLDILKQIPKDTFDLIVSNPPYISLQEYKRLPRNVLKEPSISLTDNADGFSFFRCFASIFPKILSNVGSFFLEVGWDQADEVEKIFTEKAFPVNIEKDFQGIKRIVYSIRFLNS